MTGAPTGPIRVLLVDDQPLVRAGLHTVIDLTPDLEVVAEAGTGGDAVALARRHAPDVVVMDLRMPGLDGIEATRQITSADAAPRVLVLTTFDDDAYVYGALRAGASGFTVKDMAIEQILDAIRVVAAGDGLLAAGVTRRLIADIADGRRDGDDRRSPPDRRLDSVTARELEVLVLVGQGLTNAEIAARLYISAATAKAHIARLLAKLGCRDRVQLVIVAYEAGLVDRRRT